jgi:hypothetical protein
MDLKERIEQLKAEGHGFAKASMPSFRESLTEEQRDEACRAGVGAAWSLDEAAAIEE